MGAADMVGSRDKWLGLGFHLGTDRWGPPVIPGMRVRGSGFGIPKPASARPGGFYFSPVNNPVGFF